MLDQLTVSDFVDHVNSTFRFSLDSGDVLDLELIDATAIGESRAGLIRHPVAGVFPDFRWPARPLAPPADLSDRAPYAGHPGDLPGVPRARRGPAGLALSGHLQLIAVRAGSDRLRSRAAASSLPGQWTSRGDHHGRTLPRGNHPGRIQLCPKRMGVVQRTDPPDQPKYSPLFAAGDDLWRRWNKYFRLPNLQSRVAVHSSSSYPLGSAAGLENVTLNINQMAAHSHPPVCSTQAGTTGEPASQVWAGSTFNETLYQTGSNPNGSMLTGLITPNGGSQPHSNLQPYLVVNFIIATSRHIPFSQLTNDHPAADAPASTMGRSMTVDPFVGQITTVAFNFARGRLGSVQRSTPAHLPVCRAVQFDRHDLWRRRGKHLRPAELAESHRPPPGSRDRPEQLRYRTNRRLQSVTLNSNQLPGHTHQALCFTGGSNSQTPVNGIWAQASKDKPYKAELGAGTMAPNAIGSAGGNRPHPNIMPYQALNYIIALEGIFPSRS